MGFQKSDGVPEKWWGSRKVMGYQMQVRIMTWDDGVPDM